MYNRVDRYVSGLALVVGGLAFSLFFYPTDEVVAQSVEEDQEFVDALGRMAWQGITRMHSIDAFRPYDWLTRQEAAKFFSEFSTNVLFNVMDLKRYCEFSDLTRADPTLRNPILTSCMLWLFRWSGGMFRPQQQLTRAEAITVLMRALEGNMDERGDPWRQNYYNRAVTIGLLRDTPHERMEQSISRYEVALLLKRASLRTRRR